MSAAVSTRPEAPRTDLPMAPSPPTVPKPQSTSRASKNMVSYETGREGMGEQLIAYKIPSCLHILCC